MILTWGTRYSLEKKKQPNKGDMLILKKGLRYLMDTYSIVGLKEICGGYVCFCVFLVTKKSRF